VRISTKARYGLRAMLELARCHGQAPVLMATVAERQDLSRKYLHALLTRLKTAGLVRSQRGIGGGFVLARPPDEIRLGDIIRALEGPLVLVDCVGDPRACRRSKDCAARGVWQRLAETVENRLDSVTLAEMARPNGRKGSRRRGSRAAGRVKS